MDIQFYETFIEVASTLNFRAASENLNVVQSTVSNRIQAMEEYYGKALFTRSNKSVSLTDSGKLVLPYATRIVSLHREALRVSSSSQLTTSLKIGIDTSLYGMSFRESLKDYINTKEDLSVELTVTDSKEVLRALTDDCIDIGFVYNKANINSLDFIPHVKDPFVFVMDKAVAETFDQIDKKALLDYPLIYKDYGKKFKQWAGQHVPESYQYKLRLSPGINPVDHIGGSGAGGFVLESEIRRSGGGDGVKIIRLKGVDMPYFQSYFAYKTAGARKSLVTDFVKAISS